MLLRESRVVGLPFPKHIAADIVTVSHAHEDHNATLQIEGTPFIVSGPGEYEIKGVGIVGIGVFHDAQGGATRGSNTIYRIEVDGMSVVHLGDLGHALSADLVESLDGVDILLVPVGGHYTIDAAAAATLVHEIEPSIVIPMHYQRAGLNSDIFSALLPVAAFLKELGKDVALPQPKLTVTKDKLPSEMQVVVLQ
ncbi:MAG: Zn-dependent hydrolase of the beta-lactamase fold-like protein [Microgenomates group bacterium GW2011_GWA2_47_8]|nr:MAG: Zn-dependent hydrolase of the beta-lactamase fold-like protein [Microgenomates group bacterium GW2011_GWA2_47_8]